ncbi:hypothetical protein ACFPFV_02425 [Salinicoccus siamensis]|uniref:hypothetical protein n=1 Tax=Salinicoccus siamensis TaxID=381830 RepID=UPI003613A50B
MIWSTITCRKTVQTIKEQRPAGCVGCCSLFYRGERSVGCLTLVGPHNEGELAL